MEPPRVNLKRIRVRVSYVNVAELQRRSALHFRCVLRLDGVSEDGELEAPAARHAAQLLIDATLTTARHVPVLYPAPEGAGGPTARLRPAQRRVMRWGAQIEVRELDTLGSTKDAVPCAGHIAKYATKVDRCSAGSSSRK